MSGAGASRRPPAARDLDRAAYDAVAAIHSPRLDAVLPRLTRAADGARLWLAVAAVLVAVGGRRPRAAAARGLGSLGVSSLLVNQLGKRLVRRARPDQDRVPAARVTRLPSSTSFPSGHAASAAAFAVGVALEDPEVAAPVAALAAAVAFSRVYTGVHYPGDVVAGAALGAAVAALGARVVPRRPAPEAPSRSARVQLRPRRLGAGVAVVVNPRAGVGLGELGQVAVVARLRRAVPAGVVEVVGPDHDLVEVLRRHAAGAEVLGVLGGDGSVNAAAGVALEHGLPLLVLPGGTLNHFARDLGVDDVGDALRAVTAGTAVRVDVGDVAGQVFLNTASLGSYPSFVAVRDSLRARLGKPLAALLAADRVMRREQPLPARVDGRPRELAALFVGAGRYEPPGSVPARRPRLDSGVLDVRYLDLAGRSSRAAALVRLLARHDDDAGAFVHREHQRLVLDLHGDTVLARDGEIGPVAGPRVEFSVRPGALTVYRPWRDREETSASRSATAHVGRV